jgi:hypothetical protein
MCLCFPLVAEDLLDSWTVCSRCIGHGVLCTHVLWRTSCHLLQDLVCRAAALPPCGPAHRRQLANYGHSLYLRRRTSMGAIAAALTTWIRGRGFQAKGGAKLVLLTCG